MDKHIPRTIGAFIEHFLPQLTAELHWIEQPSFFLITLQLTILKALIRSSSNSKSSRSRPAAKWAGASSMLMAGMHLTALADLGDQPNWLERGTFLHFTNLCDGVPPFSHVILHLPVFMLHSKSPLPKKSSGLTSQCVFREATASADEAAESVDETFW